MSDLGTHVADDEKAGTKKEQDTQAKAAEAKVALTDKRREKNKQKKRMEQKRIEKKRIEQKNLQRLEKKREEKIEQKQRERLEKKKLERLESKKQEQIERRKLEKKRARFRPQDQIGFPMQRLAQRENSAVRFSSVAAIDLLKIPRGRFVVDFDDVPVEASFRRSHERRLFVLLDGAWPNNRYSEPHAWDSLLPGSVLHVADPTLALSDQIFPGWYIGTRDRNYTEYLARLVERIAAGLGLARSETIFYAASSGGFAALMCAKLLPGSNCIVVNPQIDVARSGRLLKKERFAQAFDEGTDFETIVQRYRGRFSVLDAFPGADSLPAIVYAQNTKDVRHVHDHYEVFCAAYGAPAEGGISDNGRILTLLFEYGGAHGAEPLPLVRPLIAEALAFFQHSRRGAK